MQERRRPQQAPSRSATRGLIHWVVHPHPSPFFPSSSPLLSLFLLQLNRSLQNSLCSKAWPSWISSTTLISWQNKRRNLSLDSQASVSTPSTPTPPSGPMIPVLNVYCHSDRQFTSRLQTVGKSSIDLDLEVRGDEWVWQTDARKIEFWNSFSRRVKTVWMINYLDESARQSKKLSELLVPLPHHWAWAACVCGTMVYGLGDERRDAQGCVWL